MIKIVINGFGRIGRLFLRRVIDHPDIEVAGINDLGDIENLAYLFKYDTVYGQFPAEVSQTTRGKRGQARNYLVVNGREILILQEKDPAKLPWKDLAIDVVIESTGAFESFEAAQAHLKAGAKKVILTAPAKDKDGGLSRTILVGVNEDDLKLCDLSSNASCTTNAAAPVIAIMAENPGIKKAILNTVHGYTATQGLVDSVTRGKDFRRGRAAGQNIVPSTTGAAMALTRAFPLLEGKFDGIALRVPTITGSIADITFISQRKTTEKEINEIFRQAAVSQKWQGILAVTEEQIVSSDIIGDPRAAIVDLNFTKVVGGDLVKVLVWYDNEWGYVETLMIHLLKVVKLIKK